MGTQSLATGATGQGVYQTEHFTMGRSGSICEEEGPDPSTVHWLSTVEQGYDQESVPITED